MTTSSCVRSLRLAWAAWLVWGAGGAFAALDDNTPEGYRKLQAQASDQVVIRVEKVGLQPIVDGPLERRGGLGNEVSVEATVMKVARSSTNLRKGERITIIYNHVPRKIGAPGVAPIPVLKVGETRPAWLVPAAGDRSGRIYEPAAQAYSFAPVPDRLPAGLQGE